MSQHPRACQNILEYVRTSQGMSRHPRVCQDIPEQVKTSQGTSGHSCQDTPEHASLWCGSAQKCSPLGCRKEDNPQCSVPGPQGQAGGDRGSKALCQEPPQCTAGIWAAQRQETTYSSLIWNVKAEESWRFFVLTRVMELPRKLRALSKITFRSCVILRLINFCVPSFFLCV